MEEKQNSVQKNMLFNTAGSLLYYACQWIISVVIVRMSGYEDAGHLSLAMSVTASPAIVGLFNIRSYQVSDLKDHFPKATYIRSRHVTNILSFLICAVLVGLSGYTAHKAVIILTYMLYKVAEGYADVFYGVEQKAERMDISGISLMLRGVLSLILFVLVFALTHQLLWAIVSMTIGSFAILLVYDIPQTKRFKTTEKKETTFAETKGLLFTCLPLAVVAFLNNLSLNIPKIYLENSFGSEAMGQYSSVASPTLVIQLAATTLFAPLVPILTQQYLAKDKTKFLTIVKKFAALVAVLSLICVGAAKWLGEWVLVLLFSRSILPYVYLFVPIILVSILIACNACMFGICTLLRVMKPQYVIGVMGCISSLLGSVTMVRQWGMMGTVYALTFTLLVQILIQLVLIIWKINRMDGKDE